jgi:acetylornithine deacetylase/succinyl-diaminopimelate desuccinylase-like protein
MTDPAGRVRELAARWGAATSRLQAADEALLDTQVAIAGIPAPTGREERRAGFVARRLRDGGLDDVRIDDAGNAIGWCRGTTDDAPIAVLAHLDTVFEEPTPIVVRRHGARLAAPGIGDNARGLAVMLAIAAELRSAARRLRHPVLFAATTGEEGAGDLRGARHLFDTIARGARAAVAIDGAGDERVVTCALGCRRYRVEVRGPGGHSWAAFGAPNAIHAAGALVSRLRAVPLAGATRATVTVARIGGGSAINAIPADAWLEIDVRATAAAELERLDRAVRAAARDAIDDENARRRSGTPPLALAVLPLSDRPAGDVPVRDDLVQSALEATRCVGRVPELAVASTDANVPIGLGIPAIAMGGGGRGGETHTPHEWFENHEGSRGVVRALLVVASVGGAG